MSTLTYVIGVGIVGLVVVNLVATTYHSIVNLLRARDQREFSKLMWLERVERANANRSQQLLSGAAWNGIRKFVVDRKVPEADGICSFYLRPHDGKPLPLFKPGQYLTFQLPVKNVARPVIRCYSLSDAPRPDYYRVSIKRVPAPFDQPEAPAGLVSNFFHDHVREGMILDVKAPGGNFAIDLSDIRPVVLIGGGVGITPMLSMINAVADSRSAREVWLFYGVRCGSEQMMRKPLAELARNHPNLRIITCYSCPSDQDVPEEDFTVRGHVNVELLARYLPGNNYEFYICGPPPMMKALIPDLTEWGVPKHQIHTEAFGPASVKARGSAQKSSEEPAESEKPKSADATYTVHFQRSGKKLTWNGKYQNLLEFALDSGVELDSACCAGSCGTCQVAIKSGEIEYDETPEMETEEGCCLTCVGRPRTDMVLDA